MHYPKGEMCMACEQLFSDCSKLPFESYHPFSKEGEDTIVICKRFKRKESPTIDVGTVGHCEQGKILREKNSSIRAIPRQ